MKSYNILETIQGYICQACGIVLELQKLQYNRPYNDDIIQYAKGLGRTKIGSNQERGFNPNFKTLQRLNKYNSQTEYEEGILEKAEEEISRICANLKLESYSDVKEMILLKFKQVWIQLRPKGKYRNVEKLVPILTFFCLKIWNISISRSQIIRESAITKKEFNDFYQQVERFIPEYKERNKVITDLELYDKIKDDSKLERKVLNRLYKNFKSIELLEGKFIILPMDSPYKSYFKFQKEGGNPLITIYFWKSSGDKPYQFSIYSNGAPNPYNSKKMNNPNLDNDKIKKQKDELNKCIGILREFLELM